MKLYAALLVRYLRPQWRRVAALSALLLISIVLPLAGPQILRSFIDRASGGATTSSLIGLAVLFIVVAVAAQAVAVATAWFGERVGWHATNLLRADLVLHCLQLDMPFHNRRTPGELIERIDGDVTALALFFSRLVVTVLGSVLLLLGVLLLLFREDWRVGAALGLFALLALFVLNACREIAVPHVAAERQASAELFGFIEERLAGLDDIRANGAGAHVMQRFHVVMRALFQRKRLAQTLGNSIWVAVHSLLLAGTVLVLGMGAYLYRSGAITIGTVFLFFQYTQLLRRPLEQITDQLREFQRAGAGVARIHELLQLRQTIRQGEGTSLPAGALAVAFERVSFAYDTDRATDADRTAETDAASTAETDAAGAAETDAASAAETDAASTAETDAASAADPDHAADADGRVIADLSFQLRPGAVLGLLGRTGSGKTTLSRLLFRLYDPGAGVIRLGGADIRGLRLDALRRHVGIVTQEVQIFRASVRDNLTFFAAPDGNARTDDARIIEVLDSLGLGGWLSELPRGLDTELAAGGAGLSAGEAQLLAFARVFLQDPGLVILDEASSRLDPATERLIERAVDRLLKGRTGIVIAHRLATVRRADEILIIERGRLQEQGAREALLRDPGSRFAGLLRAGLAEVLV